MHSYGGKASLRSRSFIIMFNSASFGDPLHWLWDGKRDEAMYASHHANARVDFDEIDTCCSGWMVTHECRELYMSA